MVDTGYSQRKFITLNDGTKMPRQGYGTWEAPATRDLDNLVSLIKEAVKAGYRHIDTASIYGNEESIGRALKEIFSEGTVKREDLYITTKLWQNQKADVEKALKESLAKLQLDYVDLYLIHWPFGIADLTTGKIEKQIPLHVTWKALEEQVKAGRTKSIGISNFNVQLTLDLLSYAEIKPVCNQVEITPYLTQEDLVNFSKKNDIEIVAYSPLGQDVAKTLIQEPVVQELAKKYNKTPGQILLNWHLSRGYTVIPKTATASRIKENYECDTFELSVEDAKKISDLNRNDRGNDFQHKNLAFLGGIPLFA